MSDNSNMSEKKKTRPATPRPETRGAAKAPDGLHAAQAGENETPGSEATVEEAAVHEGNPGPEKSGWSEGKLEALRAENADLKDRLLRTVAEMENVRRRTERDKSDTAKYAVSNFARDVLTISDNLRRVIDHVPEEAAKSDAALKSFLEGVEVTERELLNMMERHGITRFDPSGERFDPNKHQAMFEIPNPDVPDGTIMEVVQAGYLIADRVLRPAMVGVAKGGVKMPKPAPVTEEAAGDPAPVEEPSKRKVGGTVDKSA